MVSALYPGTFDPVTYGHLDLIQRACRIFEKVVVVVAINARKKPWLSAEHRLAMLKDLTETWAQVEVQSCSGMMVDFARHHKINIIIRGMRTSNDFNDEWSIANMNRTMAPQLETVFLPASIENVGVSATIVREIAILGGDITPFVPNRVLEKLDSWGYLKS
jgi:pantetheine-phosphate adenylyltransferase